MAGEACIVLNLFLSVVVAAVLIDDVAGFGRRLEVEAALLTVVEDRVVVGLLTELLETAGLIAPPLTVEVEITVEVLLIGAGAGCLAFDSR